MTSSLLDRQYRLVKDRKRNALLELRIGNKVYAPFDTLSQKYVARCCNRYDM